MLKEFLRIWKVLNFKERKLLIQLSLIQFLSGFMDLVGVVSIAPFIGVISNPKIIDQNNYLMLLKKYLGFNNDEFILFIAASCLFLIILNQIIRMFSKWFRTFVSMTIWFQIHSRAFQYYIKQPYSYHLENNSNQILEKLQVQINSAVAGVITPIFEIISFIFTTIFLFAMLIFLDPKITTLLIIFLGIFYYIVFSNLKKKIDQFGKFAPKYSADTFKLVDQAFKSIKDIKIKQNEKFYIDLFNPLAFKYSNNIVNLRLISNFPRFFLEIFVYLFVFILILFLQKNSNNFSGTLIIIGMYALAFQKLLPAVQGIFQQFSEYKYYKPTLDLVYDEIRKSLIELDLSEQNENNFDLKFKDKIKFEKVIFKYPSSKKNIIEIDNLEINKKNFIGITGGTGAGKSTFVDLLMGLVDPNSGSITIDDKKINNTWKKNINYVPQSIFLADDSILNNIALGVRPEKINLDKVKKACCIAELKDFIENDLPDKYKTLVGENGIRLSGGQRQRIGIARAIYNDKNELLIMDESTNSLDLSTENKVINKILEANMFNTVIFITHRIQSLKKSKMIINFESGKISTFSSYDEAKKLNINFKEFDRISYEK